MSNKITITSDYSFTDNKQNTTPYSKSKWNLGELYICKKAKIPTDVYWLNHGNICYNLNNASEIFINNKSIMDYTLDEITTIHKNKGFTVSIPLPDSPKCIMVDNSLHINPKTDNKEQIPYSIGIIKLAIKAYNPTEIVITGFQLEQTIQLYMEIATLHERIVLNATI
jgi:hypothetical protein